MLSYRRFRKTISLLVAISFIFSNIALAEIPKRPTIDTKKETQITTDPEKIVIPRDYGIVKAKYTAKDSRKLVVHIQDAHCNYEAQSNIIKILECLIKNDGLSLLSVEGADGFIDTSWFKAFPDADIRKEVADYFMKKGEITGPEFLVITSDYPVKLFGAETRSYYIENLNAFTSSYPLKEDTEKYFNQIKAVLNKLKDNIYSSELKDLGAKSQDYESKKMSFTDYVKYLEVLAIQHRIPLRQYENLFKLISVFIYEKKINFTVVDKERATLIDAITKKLDKDQLKELVNKSLEFKVSKISSSEYYEYLKTIASKYGISLLEEYPNLFNYIIYNSVYSRIENEKLFSDIKKFEDAIKDKLFMNDEQRTLDKLSRNINILLGLVNIRLLNGDFDYYKEHKEEFSHEVFADFIKKMAMKFGFAYEIDPPSEAVIESMSKLEDFYAIAIKRDKALVDNTIQAMKKEDASVSVLVTGGFHSEGITKLLEKQGVSYVVVCPNITKDVETPYIKILTNQRTPLEDILADTGVITEPKNTKNSMLAPPLVTWIAMADIDTLSKSVRGVDLSGKSAQIKSGWMEAHFTAWLEKALSHFTRSQFVTKDNLKDIYKNAMEKTLKELKELSDAARKQIIKEITTSGEFNRVFDLVFDRLHPDKSVRAKTVGDTLPDSDNDPVISDAINTPNHSLLIFDDGKIPEGVDDQHPVYANLMRRVLSITGDLPPGIFDRILNDHNIGPSDVIRKVFNKDNLLSVFNSGYGLKIWLIQPKEEMEGLRVPGLVMKKEGSSFGHYSPRSNRNSNYVPWGLIDKVCDNNEQDLAAADILHEVVENMIVSMAFPGRTQPIESIDTDVARAAHYIAQFLEIELVGKSRIAGGATVGDRSMLDDKLSDITQEYLAELERRNIRKSTTAEYAALQRKDLSDIYSGDPEAFGSGLEAAVGTNGTQNEYDVICGMFNTDIPDVIKNKIIEQYEARGPPEGKKTFLVFGGGTGSQASIKPMVNLGAYVKSVQSSVDDGGSSYNIVKDLIEHGFGRMPPPGDIVNSLFSSLAKQNKLYKFLDDRGRVEFEHGKYRYYDDEGGEEEVGSFRELVKKLLGRIASKIQAGDIASSKDFAYFAASSLMLASIIDEKYFSGEEPIIRQNGSSIRNLFLIAAMDYVGLIDTKNPPYAKGEDKLLISDKDKERKFRMALNMLADFAGVEDGSVSLSHFKPVTLYTLHDTNVITIEEPVPAGAGKAAPKIKLYNILVKIDLPENKIDIKTDQFNIVLSHETGFAKDVKIGNIFARFIMDSGSFVLKLSRKSFDARHYDSRDTDIITLIEDIDVSDSHIKYENSRKRICSQHKLATDGTGLVKYEIGNDVGSYRPLALSGIAARLYFRSRFTTMQTNITETLSYSAVGEVGLVSENPIYESVLDAEGKTVNRPIYKPDPLRRVETNTEIIDDISDPETKGIVFGPGSFTTSIIPHFLVDGVSKALVERCKKGDIRIVLVINPSLDNETFGLSLTNMINLIEKTAGYKIGEMFTDIVVNKFDTTKLEQHFGIEAHQPADWYVNKVLGNQRLIQHLGLFYFKLLISECPDGALPQPDRKKFPISGPNGKPLEIAGKTEFTLRQYLTYKMKELLDVLYQEVNPEVRTDPGATSKEAKKNRGPLYYSHQEMSTIKKQNPQLQIHRDLFLAGVETVPSRSPISPPILRITFSGSGYTPLVLGDILGLTKIGVNLTRAYEKTFDNLPEKRKHNPGDIGAFNYIFSSGRSLMIKIVRDDINLREEEKLAAIQYFDQLSVEGLRLVVDRVHINENLIKNKKKGMGLSIVAGLPFGEEKRLQNFEQFIDSIKRRLRNITNNRIEFNQEIGVGNLHVAIQGLSETINFEEGNADSIKTAMNRLKERVPAESGIAAKIAEVISGSSPFKIKIIGITYRHTNGNIELIVEPESEYEEMNGVRTLKISEYFAKLLLPKRSEPMRISLGRVTLPISGSQIKEMQLLNNDIRYKKLEPFEIKELKVVLYMHRSFTDIAGVETLRLGQTGQSLTFDGLFSKVGQRIVSAGNGAITVDGKGLAPHQNTEVNGMIRDDFKSGKARLVDTVRGVEIYVVPSLEKCPYLVAHPGRGGDVREHSKRRIYFSPSRVIWYKSLSADVREQFLVHEIWHLDNPDENEAAAQKAAPIHLVLAAEKTLKPAAERTDKDAENGPMTAAQITEKHTTPDAKSYEGALGMIAYTGKLPEGVVDIIAYDTGVGGNIGTVHVAQEASALADQYLGKAIISIRGTGKALADEIRLVTSKLTAAGIKVRSVVSIAGNKTVAECEKDKQDLEALGRVLNIQDNGNFVPVAALYELAVLLAYDMMDTDVGKLRIADCFKRIGIAVDTNGDPVDPMAVLSQKIIRILPRAKPVDTAEHINAQKAAQEVIHSL